MAAAQSPGLSRALFQVRVRSVLERTDRTVNCRFLAGLVLGAELLDLTSDDPGEPILLAAAAPFLAPYRRALQQLGLGHRVRSTTEDRLAMATVAAHRLILDREEAGPGGP